MRLIRELLLLTCLLLGLILALIINVAFSFRELKTKPPEQKEIVIRKSLRQIQNQWGKQLFKDNCAGCHNRNMHDNSMGPALGGVRERWKNNDTDIYDFIRNSQAVIQGGDEYAKKLFEKWEIELPPFSNLNDEEIEAVLDYIDEQYDRLKKY